MNQRRLLKAAFGVDGPRVPKAAPRPDPFKSRKYLPPEKKFSLRTLNYLLITAGIPLSPERFILAAVCGGLVVSFAVLAVLKNPMAAVVLFGLCLALPLVFLCWKKKQIEQQLIVQMPDALGMIARALRVGQSVDSALKDVAGAVPAPFGTEIRIIYEEMRMGISFDRALRNFENRYPSLADVKIFSTAFIIQREIGGSLSQILDSLSDTIQKAVLFPAPGEDPQRRGTDERRDYRAFAPAVRGGQLCVQSRIYHPAHG